MTSVCVGVASVPALQLASLCLSAHCAIYPVHLCSPCFCPCPLSGPPSPPFTPLALGPSLLAVKGWNVRVVGLNREGRHRDVTVVQDFWSDLDAFLQSRKSSLLY